MRSLILPLLSIITLLACSQKQEEHSQPANTIRLGSVGPENAIVSNTIPPDTVFNVVPQITKASRPKATQTNTNIFFAGTKKKPVPVKNLIKCTPGIDGFIKPEVTLASSERRFSGTPRVVEAKDAYSKENNPYSFKFYSRLQGLTHDDISVITEDSKGNLWIGSLFSGISKFDGKYFTHYSETEGLAKNRVLSILEDRNGNIWVGTIGGGVSKYDGQYFTNYNTNHGLFNNTIESIFQDSKGNMWFGTDGSGVVMFDGSKFTQYSEKQGLSNNFVNSIFEDKKGDLWFSTIFGGINMFDGTSFYHFSEEQGLGGSNVRSAIVDREGNIWVATNNGVTKILTNDDPAKAKFLYYNTSQAGIKSNSALSLLEDSKGSIWIGTRGGGITKYDGERFINFSYKEGLTNDNITALFEDSNGYIWVGTYGGGIAKYQGSLFSHYSHFEGLKNSNIRGIALDKNGNLWFGSNGDGVFMYDGFAFFQYSENEGLKSNYIRDVIVDSKGNVWIATSGGGASMFDGEFFYHFDEKHGLYDNFLFSAFEDNDGNIWLGTAERGVCKLVLSKSDKFSYNIIHYNTENGLTDNRVVDILQDKNGNLWFATSYGGISMFDGNAFYNYTEKNGLISNDITSIHEDKHGNILIGQYGHGLTVFDGKYFLNITQKDGLLSNYVFSILEDKNNNLWFGTRYGLSMLPDKYASNLRNLSQINLNKLSFNQEELIFKNFTYEDGFLGIGCNPRSIFEDNVGNIWIGANDIFTVYNNQKRPGSSQQPNMQIIRLELFNTSIDWTAFRQNKDTVLLLDNGIEVCDVSFSGLGKWDKLPKNLKLTYNNNYVTFKFVGITTSFPSKNRYQYKLDGLDDKWSSLTHRNEAHYANLPPGNYNFRVRAINSDGIWSNEASYSFSVRPPWWKTNIAYLIYSVLIVLVLVFIYKIRKTKSKQKELEKEKAIILQQEVALAKKSVDFKKNFLANMSHEIRTPLTGILGMAEILSKTSLDEFQRDYMNTLVQSGENLREIINLILDYSKLEAGQVRIKYSSFSVSDFFDNINNLYSPLCKKKRIRLDFIISSKISKHIRTDRNKLDQIVNNLLSNALKFTDNGEILVRVSLDERISDSGVHKDKRIIGIKVEVKDTGKGISSDEQSQLFKPFAQIEHDQVRRIEGTGLGLSICKELVEILGGEIGVKSQQGYGSTFWFTFKATHAEEPKSMAQVDKEYKKPKTSPLYILLAEDKVITQKIVKLMLNSLGHIVEFASNGEEVIKAFELYKFDLILMDIQMPVMDGVTATHKLREKFSELPPIVGLSANAFEGDREKYMALGLDEYLTKPVKEEDFINLLEKLNLQ